MLAPGDGHTPIYTCLCTARAAPRRLALSGSCLPWGPCSGATCPSEAVVTDLAPSTPSTHAGRPSPFWARKPRRHVSS